MCIRDSSTSSIAFSVPSLFSNMFFFVIFRGTLVFAQSSVAHGCVCAVVSGRLTVPGKFRKRFVLTVLLLNLIIRRLVLPPPTLSSPHLYRFIYLQLNIAWQTLLPPFVLTKPLFSVLLCFTNRLLWNKVQYITNTCCSLYLCCLLYTSRCV